MSTGDRVALVVVHGIADQRPRQTLREVARLLCRGGQGAPAYEHGEMVDVLVPVEKLEPGGGPLKELPSTPPVEEVLKKTQAARRQPGAPSGFYQAQQIAPLTERRQEIERPSAAAGRAISTVGSFAVLPASVSTEMPTPGRIAPPR